MSDMNESRLHLLRVVGPLRIAQHESEEGHHMTSPPQAPVKVPSHRVVMGQVVEVEESYAREVGVPPVVLIPVLLAALFVDIIGLLVSAVLRIGVPTAR